MIFSTPKLVDVAAKMLAAASILCVPCMGRAQDREAGPNERSGVNTASSQVAVGLQFGYSMTDLWGPDAAALRPRFGWLAGMRLWTGRRANRGLQVEINYSRRGAETTKPSLFDLQGRKIGAGAPTIIKLTYVDVPLLLWTRMPFIGKQHQSLNPRILVGPVFSVPQSASFRQGDNEITTNGVSSWEVGILVGAEIGQGKTGLGVRYHLGLTNIESRPSDTQSHYSFARGVLRDSVFSVVGWLGMSP